MIRLMTVLSLAMAATLRTHAAEPSTAIPEDTAVYMHVNLAKLWDSPIGKAMTANPSPEVKKSLDLLKNDFGLTPEMFASFSSTQSIEQMTPESHSLVRFRKPYQRAVVIAGLKKQISGTNDFYTEDEIKYPKYEDDGKMFSVKVSSNVIYKIDMSDPTWISIAMYFNSDGTAPQLIDGKNNGPLAKVVTLAQAKDSLVTIGVNFAQFPVQLLDEDASPELKPFQPLIQCEVAWLNAKLDGDTIAFENHYQAENGRKAKEAERSLGVLRLLILTQIKALHNESEASKELPVKAVIPLMEKIMPSLNAMKITVEGKEAIMKGSLPIALDLQPLYTLMFVKESSKSTMAMRPTPISTHLKQLGLALHGYRDVDAKGKFPTAYSISKRGKPLLSWRVHVLPYIEQVELYKKFNLDEPWDSEHNMKVMKENPMPSAFALTKKIKPNETDTHLQAFVGKDTIITTLTPTDIMSIADGTSNTFMLGVAAKAIPWTKPEDIDVDGKADVITLLLFDNDVTHICFGDGSVQYVKKTINADSLKALITRSGGEVVSLDD